MIEARNWRTPAVVVGCGAVVLALAVGIRHGFGLFLQPMSLDNGWGREVFAFALAVQNLVWGAAQPVTGMIADRFGAARAVLGGAVLYVAGLMIMAWSTSPGELVLGAGFLIGLGLSGTSFSVVFGAVGRAVPPEKRSMAMGISSAVGSFGQFAMLPGSLAFITWFGWSGALLALAALAALMLPLSAALAGEGGSARAEPNLSVRGALAEAFAHRGFWLLCFGFFVCGFQIVFIGVHLPSYLLDNGLGMGVATTVLALVGLFNIAGSYVAGLWGARARKPMILSLIYIARGVFIAAFISFPVTAWTAYAFGIAMGFLWLSTVPLTNGTVASVFGVKNLSMLGGIVFFFHQVGSFGGTWLGGYAYDRTGSYDLVWVIAIALSGLAAVLNWPIRETPVPRLAAAARQPA